MSERLNRLFSIIDLLSDGKVYTYGNLASRFGVSKLTIYKDIIELSSCYPITTSQGYGGGVSFIYSVKSIRKDINREEVNLLLRALSAFQKENSNINLEILIQKIEKNFGRTI